MIRFILIDEPLWKYASAYNSSIKKKIVMELPLPVSHLQESQEQANS